MRRVGIVADGSRCVVGDHVCWVHDSERSWQRAATTFLAEGAARGERLLYTAGGKPAELEADLRFLRERDLMIESDRLLLCPVEEFFEDRADILEVLVAEALAEGFAGLRLAIEASALATAGDDVVGLEFAVDLVAASSALTTMCGYDDRIDTVIIDELCFMHPLSNRDRAGQTCLYRGPDGHLRIAGEINISNADTLAECLDLLPGEDAIHLWTDELGFADLAGIQALLRLRRPLIVHDPPAPLRQIFALTGWNKGSSLRIEGV